LKKIRLSKPTFYNKRGLLKGIDGILTSGFLTQGRFVEKFERAVADYAGTKYAIAVSSATAGLQLALKACGITKNQRVIVPDFTFPATVNMVEAVQAIPVLVDINPSTYNLDPSKIEELFSRFGNNNNIKAIMPVHQFGNPSEMEKINFYARKHNLFVIEDAACALGAEYRGKKAGSLGDVGIFSFHPRKLISTGEGGMIITDNKKIFRKCSELRNHSLVFRGNKRYVVNAGYNYRLPEISALMGYTQMKQIERIIRERSTLADYYSHLLQDIPFLACPKPGINSRHAFQTYAILVKNPSDRDRLISVLASKNIEAGAYDYCMHRQPYYSKKYNLKDDGLENSLFVSKRIIILPLYLGMEKEKIKRISKQIRSYFYGDNQR